MYYYNNLHRTTGLEFDDGISIAEKKKRTPLMAAAGQGKIIKVKPTIKKKTLFPFPFPNPKSECHVLGI